MRRLLVTAVMVVVIGGACGSGGGGDPTASPTPTSDTDHPAGVPRDPADPQTAAAASGAPPGSAGNGESTGGEQAATGSQSPSRPSIPSRKLDLEVELASECVRPGTTQTITVRSEPGSAVVYGTSYSDGKTGFSEDHYGGNASGHVDEQGEYQDTFVVSAEAPEGPVRVDVAAIAGDGAMSQAQLEFAVSDVLGKCS